MIRWIYGVTTVPARRRDLLPGTLASLGAAGFSLPVLFVDGPYDTLKRDCEFDNSIVEREDPVRTFGNWALAIHELYIRDPFADRYAVFQDDILSCQNLRGYLDECNYPKHGYWNLYTCRDNEPVELTPSGWHLSNQHGRGALGLVFDGAAMVKLLTSPIFVEHPRDKARGWRSIDGAVMDAMKSVGYQEWIHNPSLLQHTGAVSQTKRHNQPVARSFPGESTDARAFLAAR